MLTKEQFAKCLPYASHRNIDKFYESIIAAMEFFGIRTKDQIAAFLAQIAHESGSLKYVKELASGEAYEGRKDLGNIVPGDGILFKGRGLIQITGRANYKQVSKALNYDFIRRPHDLEKPGAASYSAAWYWDSRRLNRFADGTLEGFKKITKLINGGYNGLGDRLKHWERIKSVLNDLSGD